MALKISFKRKCNIRYLTSLSFLLTNLESDCLHFEILRKGSLVLLSDLLCENIGNVEYTTWVIVNYTQNLVNSINESPVQDFVMSVHRTASSSGLLLQGMFS